MISWGDAHRRAVVAASELHADLDLDLTQPIDVFGAVRQLGLVLAFAPLGKVSGLYLPRHPTAGILLHQGHPRTRQRYTAGHELGHHVFRHAADIDLDLKQTLQRSGGGRDWPDHEKEAEAFGAWFLMPRKLMRRGLLAMGIDRPRDPLDVYALSLWLGTSYTATARQLAVVKIVDPETADAWARIQPATLKRTLAGDMVPDDLRNDVWWLDGRHSGQPVDARPGDRLVLTLQEIPSSGYGWRFDELPPGLNRMADSFEDDWEPELGRLTTATAQGGPLVGGAHARSFVLEVDPGAVEGILRVALIKDQPWDAGPPTDAFELLIAVSPPLHGVQLPEDELALAG